MKRKKKTKQYSFPHSFQQEHGALKAFFDTIMANGGYVLNDIKNYSKVTILAPSNEAWENPAIEHIRKYVSDWWLFFFFCCCFYVCIMISLISDPLLSEQNESNVE